MVDKKTFFIIDGTSCVYRAFHAIPRLTNAKGEPTNAVYGFAQTLRKIIKDKAPDLIAVTFDVKGPSFRHELFDKYKIERPPMPDDLSSQIPYIKKIARVMGLPVLEMQGFEADDVIATLTARALAEGGIKVCIVTGDKDMMQLVNDDVCIYDYTKDKEYGEAGVMEKLGVPPLRVVDLMAFAGDTSDNVPGIKGIGPKTAAKLVNEYGSVDDIYSNISNVKPEKLIEKLKEGEDIVRLSRELVTLRRDVPVEGEVSGFKQAEPDYEELENLLNELGFTKLVKDLIPRPEAVVTGFTPVDSEEGIKELSKKLAGSATLSVVLLNDGEAGVALFSNEAFYIDSLKAGGADTVAAALADVLKAKGIEKSTDDAKALYKFCRRRGIEPSGIVMDTSVASYLLNSSAKSHSIEDVSYAYLGETLPATGEGGLLEPGAASARASIVAKLTPILSGKLRETGMDALFVDIELPLSFVLADMEEAGIEVDVKSLGALSLEMDSELKRLEKEIYDAAGCEFNVNSPKQLSEVLFGKLGLKPVKKTKTGFSTDEAVLTALSTLHKVPAGIIAFRQIAKLKSTYVDSLVELADKKTSRVHTTLNQTVTATGRLSSSNPNLQNIPVKGEYAAKIRGAFVAKKGFKLVCADYSQIELRLVAHLSDDAVLIDAFNKGEDIHARTASEVFGIMPGIVTSEMRRRAKAINFGIIYGMGAHGLSVELGISVGEAKGYIDMYFERHKGVKAFMDSTIKEATESGFTKTLFGRVRYIPELNSSNEQTRRFGERMAVNTPVQGSAADVIKAAMLKVHDGLSLNFPKARLLLQIHDELIVEAADNEVDEIVKLVRKEMEGVISLKVPLTVNVGSAASWQKAG
ncbi:MAG: DNA polymerase I [Deltaproteobacteria bacterium]|nr:DNA polymerase I [Deltaproteobacteria bacterium]